MTHRSNNGPEVVVGLTKDEAALVAVMSRDQLEQSLQAMMIVKDTADKGKLENLVRMQKLLKGVNTAVMKALNDG